MRGIFIQNFLYVPDDGIGIDGRAVVKLNAWAQLENPFCLIVRVDGPRSGQARDHSAGCVRLSEVPLCQGIVHGDAGKPVALEALVRLTERAWNVCGGHADTQDFFLRRGGHRSGDRKCRGEHGKPKRLAH